MFFIKKTNLVKILYIYINSVRSKAALLVDKHNKTYIILDKIRPPKASLLFSLYTIVKSAFC